MTENNDGSFGPLPPRPQNPPSRRSPDMDATDETRDLPPTATHGAHPAEGAAGVNDGDVATGQNHGHPPTAQWATSSAHAEAQTNAQAQTPSQSEQASAGEAGTHENSERVYGDPPYSDQAQANQNYGGSFGDVYAQPFGQPAAPRKQDKKRVGAGTFITGMLLAGLLGGTVAVGADTLLDDGSSGPNNGNNQSQSVVVNDTDSVNEITGAAAKASPSVVTISVSGGSSSGSGSGIILDTDGHILTNTHVVTLGGQVSEPAVEVRTNDGRVFEASVTGIDPLSDLAVIKIDAPDLQPATLADSSDLNVGDRAIAIGSPLGLSGTVTDGIISTLNRTISVQSSAVPEEQSDAPQQDPGDGFNFLPPDGSQAPQQGNQGSIYLNVIQTDAAINQGNSGGALVDSEGRIIGVNVAIASAGSGESAGNIGVGFSIPINYGKRVADEIIANGEATHGFLGVSVGPASANSGGSSSFSIGAEVQSVESGSPAETAGLQEGDIITKVGELPITDPRSLTAAVRMLAAGESTQVELTRGGETTTIDVTVAAPPEE